MRYYVERVHCWRAYLYAMDCHSNLICHIPVPKLRIIYRKLTLLILIIPNIFRSKSNKAILTIKIYCTGICAIRQIH